MFYTDYPMIGNESRQEIEVALLTYDRNKYVTVKFGDYEDSVKSGYIYKYVSGKKKSLSKKDILSLPACPEDRLPSRKSVENEIKLSRKRKTTYTVWVSNERVDFDTLKSMIKYVIHKTTSTSDDICVSRCVTSKHSWSTTPIFEIEGNEIFEYGRNGVARSSGWLSKRHYRMLHSITLSRNI